MNQSAWFALALIFFIYLIVVGMFFILEGVQ